MSKFKIINLFDKIFISCAIFLIIFAWVNFYLRNLWATFFLSLIFSFACCFILFYLTQKKQAKKSLSKKSQQEANENFLAFKLTPKKKKLELLNKIISIEHESKIINNHIAFEVNGKKYVLLIATHIEKLNETDLINLLDEFVETETNVIQIICNDYVPNLNTKIYKNKEIILIDKSILYKDYFSKHNIFPNKSNLNLSSTKLKFKDILKNIIQPQKAKSYFICGLILILSSIILPFHAYYVIVGSMLMLFSIICKIYPKFIEH